MEDLLLRSAVEYEKLMDTEYLFHFGRKGNLYNVTLTFPKDCFHHIAGLKKLSNTYLRKRPRGEIFDRIRAGLITEKVLTDDPSEAEVRARLQLTANLKNILESDNLEYLFHAGRAPFPTRIEADYLFVTYIQEKEAFLFLSKPEDSESCFCRSLFFKKTSDYSQGQPKLTLLYKGRKNLLTGETEALYGIPRSGSK